MSRSGTRSFAPQWSRESGWVGGQRWFTVALLSVMILCFLPSASASVSAQTSVRLTVGAAADLQYAFTELGERFTEDTGVEVDFNFGSTGQLTEQIRAGAPIDVFAAANVAFVDALDDEGLIISDTKTLYARGRIVMWTRADSDLTIETLDDLSQPGVARIAIANPDHAPYGIAAREAMISAGIWDDIQDKLILGDNIRATLQFAETGNVDVAIVALSLAIVIDGSWHLVPEELHEPIDQALAVVADTRYEVEARAFADFVNADDGREVMRRYGFVLPDEEPFDLATPAATPIGR